MNLSPQMAETLRDIRVAPATGYTTRSGRKDTVRAWGYSLGTLNALGRRGLIVRRVMGRYDRLGAATRGNMLEWRVTDAGRAAVSAEKGGGDG